MIYTKNDILEALMREPTDRMLLAQTLDKWETCQEKCYLTHTAFLDLRERALVRQAILMAGGGECLFLGGYEGAERTAAVFLPEYLSVEDVQAGELSPIVLLRAHKNPADQLTHRDYLGALMGMQIKRAMIGDILVHEQGADILVMREIAAFILLNFNRAGRKRITLTEEPLGEVLRATEDKKTTGQGAVASMRLDSVVALIFGLSRGEAQQAISKGLVFLNDLQGLKQEQEVKLNDRITLRGMGRAQICALGGLSRKGRQFITFTRTGR